MRGFVSEQIVAKGAAADVCFHDVKARDGERNFHAHVLYTTREVNEQGLGKKLREFDQKAHVVEMRAAWADHANWALEQARSAERVDHRSLKEQAKEALERGDLAKLAKVDREPTVYLKRVDFEREQRGEVTPTIEKKRAVAERNAERSAFYKRAAELGDKAREAFLMAREKVGDILQTARHWREKLGLTRSEPAQERETSQPERETARMTPAAEIGNEIAKGSRAWEAKEPRSRQYDQREHEAALQRAVETMKRLQQRSRERFLERG